MGINHHVHVICAALFSVYAITRRKNRETIKALFGIEDDEVLDKILITDDAKQYWSVALLQALCWLHEIRHYKKLCPFFHSNKKALQNFLTELWEYYGLLNDYRENPSEDQKQVLSDRFDALFSTKTDYDTLDKRIALTRDKKEKLLLVLDYPEIPLHNNPAEIALREFVIKKRISYGTRSEAGKASWENKMTILDTCRKLGVNFLDYIRDIFSGEQKMPRLADLILEHASA